MEDLVERLARHRTLGSAPRDELVWLATHGRVRRLDEGEILSRKGVPVTGMYIVLDGRIAIYVDRGAGRHKALEWRGGDVAGLLPYSRLVSPPSDSVAQEPSEVLALQADDFPAMIRECHTVTSILVHAMIDRSRAFTSSGLQDEKMVSLGKLSAGLAHELNNPAAALERSAALLEQRLEDGERAVRALGTARLTDAQIAAIDEARVSCLAAPVAGVLTPLQQAEREDALADWLEDHGVDPDVAGTLSETAITVEALDRVAAAIDGPALEAALRGVAAGCSIRSIVSEIRDASRRISGLVAAVKGFTHMDQAMVAEPVNLETSLGNTVAVLRSKAKARSAAVTIDVAADLPPVRGFAGELNQIWANLIDNALDAVADGGRIEVTARGERDGVVVRVVDNGPGIAPEVRERIFEPFVTTKPVGQGMGLGLDIVRRLVVHNDAAIDVDSAPGRTEFRITFPPASVERSGKS